MFKGLKPIVYNGHEVWPLVEGGKGVAATNHASAGAWAAAGGIGTVSAVNADSYDPDGKIVPQIYKALTRRERHEELVEYAIEGAVQQVKRAFEIAGGKGAININVLWEMGGAQRILHGVLERTRGLVSGVTCGAGMPYKLSEITASYGVSYLPIVSSGRAFRALWKRAYSKAAEWLAAVVYEDPWLAGGHNGLSNAEDPLKPQNPYPRVKELRDVMREGGISDDVPIVMAGGVWYLRDWNDWIDNPELGTIAFQFGTRPLLTRESPIPQGWKDELTRIEEDGVLLHKFSPTGFYSSAVRNPFLRSLEARSERQIAFSTQEAGDHVFQLDVGVKGKNFWVTRGDLLRARGWFGEGYTDALKTPDNTLVFVDPGEKGMIRKDQADCMGCLSQCSFSSWADTETNSTGRLADPRSFCIQKTLQDIAHGGDIEQNLMFAGHAAYNFKKDPFYSNGFVPSVGQLVDRILTGIDRAAIADRSAGAHSEGIAALLTGRSRLRDASRSRLDTGSPMMTDIVAAEPVSRAVNVSVARLQVEAMCAKHKVGISAIETLPSGGTRVVFNNAEDAARIVKAFGSKVLAGNVARTHWIRAR